MNYNYEPYLTEKLNIIKNTIEELNDFVLEISTEQAFTKIKTFKPNTIYVVIKYLTNSLSFGTTIQPIQIMALSEQNSLEGVKKLFSIFSESHNFQSVEIDETTYIKQQYTNPVVMSNFNEIGFGYRSIIYLTGTLYIMENVVDVKELYVDGDKIEQLTFAIAYSMTGNTQPLGSDELASTVKNISSLNVTLTIPMIESNLLTKVLKKMNGSESGNEDFEFYFKLGNVQFGNSGLDSDDEPVLNMKLISSNISTAPYSIPSIQLNFMR